MDRHKFPFPEGKNSPEAFLSTAAFGPSLAVTFTFGRAICRIFGLAYELLRKQSRGFVLTA
jgi:hypothetical protein